MSEEEELVRAFVVKEKRDRLAELLASPKRRRKATAGLAHFRDLDPRFVVATRCPGAQSGGRGASPPPAWCGEYVPHHLGES